MYVLGLNGPPRCGKDTFAGMLTHELEKAGVLVPIHAASLATPMRAAMMTMVGLDAKDDQVYEQAKQLGIKPLGGVNLRQLMIDFSEEFMKPKFGQPVWSELLAAKYPRALPGILIIRDMGFEVEADFWREWAGADNFCVLRIHREGKTFKHDSREWVTHTFMDNVFNYEGLHALSINAESVAAMLKARWTLV